MEAREDKRRGVNLEVYYRPSLGRLSVPLSFHLLCACLAVHCFSVLSVLGSLRSKPKR